MTQQKLHRTPAACLIIKTILLYTLLATCKPAYNQETFVKPPARLLTSFPFRLLSGGVIIVTATVGNIQDSLNFILDTGSGGISFDSSTVAYFQMPLTPSDISIRGIAGIKKVSFVRDQVLHLPNLDVKNLDFHVNDYEILTSVYGIKIDGIIGFAFLRRYIIKVNYDNYTIEVWSPGTIRLPKQGFMMRPRLNFIPVVDSYISDGRACTSKFYFDTGAGLCFLLSEEFVKDSAVLKKTRKIINTQGEGVGGKKQMRLTTVKEVKLGPYKFRNVPVHLFDDEFGITNYPELAGLLGNDLLRRFNLVMNYETREFHLSPNTHYLEPFDYSYTGLGIYLVDGEIVVEDVIPESPGEKAGLKPGDVIMAIDNNFSGNIQTYKTMLQVAKARLKIIIRRDNELKQVYLTVQSIL